MSGSTNHEGGQRPGNEDFIRSECRKPRAGEVGKKAKIPDQEDPGNMVTEIGVQ